MPRKSRKKIVVDSEDDIEDIVEELGDLKVEQAEEEEVVAAPKKAKKAKKPRKPSAYNIFVKKTMQSPAIKKLPHTQKFKAVAVLWKKHKAK